MTVEEFKQTVEFPQKPDQVAKLREYSIDLLEYESSDIHLKHIGKWYNSSSDYALIYKMFLGFGILTGSCGLRAYGLLERKPTDIDIVVSNKEDKRLLSLIKKFGPKIVNVCDDTSPRKQESTDDMYESAVCVNRISKLHMFGIAVDVFYLEDVLYRTSNGLMIQDPIQLIKHKLDIYRKAGREKDSIDLGFIFSQLRTYKTLLND